MDRDFIHGQQSPGLPSSPFHLDANADFVPAKSHCCGPGSGGGGDDGGFQLFPSWGSQLYQSLEEGQEVLEPMKLELLRASSVVLFQL